MPNTKSKVCVAILNYNGAQLLSTYLPSVIAHSEADIYVIDNASTDNSITFIQQNYPTVKLIQFSENYGFAGGYNKALKQLNYDYVILLNSDVEVSAQWITPLVNSLEENELAAAVQPKILDYKRKDYFEYAGAAGGYLDFLGYPFARGRIFNELEKDTVQYKSDSVFWASGACFCIRKRDFESVNGFDEDFFAHMEEIDLCYRLKNRGKVILANTESTVYHLGGGTLSNTSAKKTFLNFRNSLLMLLKNDFSTWLFFKLFFRLILDGIAGIQFFVSGKFKHTLAIIQAHFNFYSKIPLFLKKRKHEKTQASKNKNTDGYYPYSIVYMHFIKKISVFSKLPRRD
ncbi:MAG: glycosyltransferase family 2 protein [Luteibaculaceae bacterium]